MSRTGKLQNIKEGQGWMICWEFFNLILALVFLLSGAIMYRRNQHYIVTSVSAETVVTLVYPHSSIPHYVSSAGSYPNQASVSQSGGGAHVSWTTNYTNKVVAIKASVAGSVSVATSITYLGQGPPLKVWRCAIHG